MSAISNVKVMGVRTETDSLGDVDVPEREAVGSANATLARTFQHWAGSDAAGDDCGLRHS